MATFTGTNNGEILPSIPLGVLGALGNDTVFGLGGDDIVIGWTGDDTLNGGAGEDLLVGGLLNVVLNVGTISASGNDTADYSTSSSGVTVDLSVTDDFTLTLLGIEVGVTNATRGTGGDAQGDVLVGINNLTGSESGDFLGGNDNNNVLSGLGGNDTLLGGGGIDNLFGGAGNDTLDGGAGVDTMDGGSGNDAFLVNAGNEVVVEAIGGGVDTITTSVSYVLQAGVEVEILQSVNPAGTTGINLVGNDFAQTIIGNNGLNILNGNGGADVLQGFGGKDTYIVNMNADVVMETADGGLDQVLASASYTLKNGVYVEGLGTTNVNGLTAISLTGNAFNQTVAGNAGANVINGGAGNDRLIGNLGRDSFSFSNALVSANVDVIVDFTVADDTIRLENGVFTGLANGVLAAGALAVNLTGGATDADDRIIYNSLTGDLFFDQDGAGGAAGVCFAHMTAGLLLTNADFFVV